MANEIPPSLNDLCEEMKCSPAFKTETDKIFIADVSSFPDTEIRDSPFDLLVRKGKIYLIPNPSYIHVKTIFWVQTELQNIFDPVNAKVQRGFLFDCITGLGLDGVPDIYGCTKRNCRVPDAIVSLSESVSGKAVENVMAVEVRFRNKNLADLLTLGAGYLTKWTRILYVLLLDLQEIKVDNEMQLKSIRVFLLERKDRQATFAERQEGIPTCIDIPEELEHPEKMKTDDIENTLNVRIIFDKTITRTDVANRDFDLNVKLSSKAIIRITSIPDLLGIPVVELDMKAIAGKVFRLADALIVSGTYPNS